jgi:Family of unknown function (DUF6455)
LRWINAGPAELVQIATMIRFYKPQTKTEGSPPEYTDTVRNMAKMSERLGLSTVPAAWPASISQLAQAIDACQRCDADELCNDWLARAPQIVKLPPEFCPNAAELNRAKQA